VNLPGGGMSWKSFLKGLKAEISKDQIPDVAATVTYYGVLALFPFLLFLVALVSVVITPSDAEKLVQELGQVAPGAVTQIVGERIRQLGEDENTTLLGFGAAGAIWAASGGLMALMRALNTTYDVAEGRPFWKVRGIALLMTVVFGALALAAALAAVATPPLAEAIGGPIGTAILWLRLPIAGLVMMFLWALVYWVLPDVEQKFRFITPGSVAGVLLWVLASWAFSKYVANFGSYDKTYGALGGVIVLLLWMWLSALVLLVGAEANALIEHRSADGKRQGAKSKHDTGLTPKAEVPPKGAPLPVGAARAGTPGRGWRVPVREQAAQPSKGHARLGGLAGAAVAFVAGALLTRSRAG
jgi:membrane protein